MRYSLFPAYISRKVSSLFGCVDTSSLAASNKGCNDKRETEENTFYLHSLPEYCMHSRLFRDMFNSKSNASTLLVTVPIKYVVQVTAPIRSDNEFIRVLWSLDYWNSDAIPSFMTNYQMCQGHRSFAAELLELDPFLVDNPYYTQLCE